MNLLLIGRPNVGKSSIFNVLVNKDLNIVHQAEGTTIDWNFLNLKQFPNIKIFDSPGFKTESNKLNVNKFITLYKFIDVFLYVVDYNLNQHLNDKEAINYLRKFNKDIILLINKDDQLKKQNNFEDYGINKKFYLSCSHKLGFSDLIDYFSKYKNNNFKDLKIDYSISIYGKPNAGKSTLLNKILGYKRSFTSSVAGTTSDIVVDTFTYNNKVFKIFDTAGIGKKTKVKKQSINFLAIKKSISNIKESNLNLFIVDSIEGFDRQSKKIYSLLIKSQSLIIIFNKIDLIENKKKFYSDIKYQLKNDISSSQNLTLVFISALVNKDINIIKKLIYLKSKNSQIKVSTNKINIWLKKAVLNYPHPLIKGKKVNFKYATQINTKPITIKIFCNFPSKIIKSFRSYLLKDFTKKFKIKDEQVKFIFSSTDNPFI